VILSWIFCPMLEMENSPPQIRAHYNDSKDIFE